MAKQVPTPRKPDDSKYVKGLTPREGEIFDLYKEISESRDEKLLIQLVKQSTIKPTTVNKEGQNPLMFAVDSDFSDETVKTLIDLGCNVNAQNSDGMTSLHLSAHLKRSNTFKMLLERGADPTIEDVDGDTGHTLALENKVLKSVIEHVLGSGELATSMSKS